MPRLYAKSPRRCLIAFFIPNTSLQIVHPFVRFWSAFTIVLHAPTSDQLIPRPGSFPTRAFQGQGWPETHLGDCNFAANNLHFLLVKDDAVNQWITRLKAPVRLPVFSYQSTGIKPDLLVTFLRGLKRHPPEGESF